MPATVDGARLWRDLMAIARTGATRNGGCHRLALSDLDLEARALFAKWCADYGFEISFDSVGNMFTRMQCKDEASPPLVMGSHLDTQPTGGKFDGVLGVLAGLKVMRSLADRGVTPERDAWPPGGVAGGAGDSL